MSTTKLLLRLSSSDLIESVIIRHRAKQLRPSIPPDEEHKDAAAAAAADGHAGRITLCVSSQVGCKQACTFCATGAMGLKGQLSAGEIVEQLVHANRLLAIESPGSKVTNVVYMGQGEPLDNYAALLASIDAFTSPRLFGLSPARITVSTVGLTRRIVDLITDAPHVQLALSLHAPDQALRLRLVPSSAAYTLPRLLDALHQYTAALRKRVLIEYILIRNVNASPSHAAELCALLQPLMPFVAVNLIPYNPVYAASAAGFEAPEVEEVRTFQKAVQQAGIFCTVRQEMGRDVQGACGQLALSSIAPVAADAAQAVRDIEDAGACKPQARRSIPKRAPEKSPATCTADGAPATEAVYEGRAWRALLYAVLPALVVLLLALCFR